MNFIVIIFGKKMEVIAERKIIFPTLQILDSSPINYLWDFVRYL